MDILQVNEISKSFGSVSVLNRISFSLKKGSFGCLLGSSGSGKSTLLRLIAGLEIQDSGSIVLAGKTVSDDRVFVKPENRHVGMIFQDYALFPHLTVEKNILFGVKDKLPTAEFDLLAEVLGLRELLARYPHQVSGGQQQRVAIARSLMVGPQILLMDEPFSNLDEWMKEEVRDELKNILRKLGATVLFVTHHAQDALSFADHIMVMDGGRILQQGPAQAIIDRPVSARVAGIFGKVNRFDHTTLNRLFGMNLPEGKYFIRPEHFTADAGGCAFAVSQAIYHGQYYDVDLEAEGTRVHIHWPGPVEQGSSIRIKPLTDKIFHEQD